MRLLLELLDTLSQLVEFPLLHHEQRKQDGLL